jgi:hypothetical protein
MAVKLDSGWYPTPMPNPSPWWDIKARDPRFKRSFTQRVARGDTLDDLQFWIRTKYGVKVSRETIRAWKHHVNGAA